MQPDIHPSVRQVNPVWPEQGLQAMRNVQLVDPMSHQGLHTLPQPVDHLLLCHMELLWEQHSSQFHQNIVTARNSSHNLCRSTPPGVLHQCLSRSSGHWRGGERVWQAPTLTSATTQAIIQSPMSTNESQSSTPLPFLNQYKGEGRGEGRWDWLTCCHSSSKPSKPSKKGAQGGVMP